MSLTYFISDLHLSADREDITQCLFEFLKTDAAKADAVYVLGDLFEVWIGDDDITPFSESVAAAFKSLSARCPVYFIHGNRDFAVGKNWLQKAGMTLLAEQTVIDLYGDRTLVSHGDELCTRDIAYQKFRKKSRGWWWLPLMLSLPLWYRRRVARKGRETSKANQQGLRPDIMDVTEEEVLKVMAKFGVQQLIHGHTHRPNIHMFTVNGKPARRIVLGDWYDQGSILRVAPGDLHLEKRTFI